jgi:hypothetical protein
MVDKINSCFLTPKSTPFSSERRRTISIASQFHWTITRSDHWRGHYGSIKRDGTFHRNNEPTKRKRFTLKLESAVQLRSFRRSHITSSSGRCNKIHKDWSTTWSIEPETTIVGGSVLYRYWRCYRWGYGNHGRVGDARVEASDGRHRGERNQRFNISRPSYKRNVCSTRGSTRFQNALTY